MQAWRTAKRGLLLAALAGVAILFLVPRSAHAEAALVEGQTATGGTTHSFSQDQPTQADAINAAMNNCLATSFNCHVLRQFNSTCFALAYAQGGGYGYAFGSDLPEAHRAALGQCSAANPYTRCDIVKSFCDTVNQQQAEAQRAKYIQDWYACANDHNQSACERDLAIATRDGDRALLTQWRDAVQQATAAATRQEASSAFDTDLSECGSFSISACDRGLASPLASAADIDNMKGWRATAVTYTDNREACKSGNISACDAALASPAITDTGRQLIADWRNNSPSASRLSSTSSTTPDSVKFGVGVLVFLAVSLILSFVAVSESRREPIAGASGTETTSTLDTKILNFGTAVGPSEPPPIPSAAELAAKPLEPSRALVTVPETPTVEPIDTPAALRALALAASYLEETSDQNFSDPDDARAARTTLALASRQLDIAFRSDPNAKLEVDNDVRISQARLRSRVLRQEALTWGLENLSKAAEIAERATLADPTYAGGFDTLGFFQFHNRNRLSAITALTRASELDPNNIETLKLLDRAENMGAAEIASFKATKAGVRVANAGISVYNAGVHTRNFFVIIWNIFATFWNVISFPVRLMERIVGFIFGGGR